MLTQTSESAIRLLVFLTQEGGSEPIGLRYAAEQLGESPSYMAKVTSLLVKASILRAHRGAMGGVTLGKPAHAITLLSIFEACQGTLVGDYCQVVEDLASTCAYHQAAFELHQAISGVLSRWTLADIVANPGPSRSLAPNVLCRMRFKQAAASATGRSSPRSRASLSRESKDRKRARR